MPREPEGLGPVGLAAMILATQAQVAGVTNYKGETTLYSDSVPHPTLSDVRHGDLRVNSAGSCV